MLYNHLFAAHKKAPTAGTVAHLGRPFVNERNAAHSQKNPNCVTSFASRISSCEQQRGTHTQTLTHGADARR